MKKYSIVLIVLLIMIFMTGCSSDRVDIGVEDGKAYFHDWGITPEIILHGENETVILNDSLFYKLMGLVNGKPIVEDLCNCEAKYNISIHEYALGLHTHGIEISVPVGRYKKETKVFSVECTEQEMNELFDVLESAK